jgi:hypothetical protein
MSKASEYAKPDWVAEQERKVELASSDPAFEPPETCPVIGDRCVFVSCITMERGADVYTVRAVPENIRYGGFTLVDDSGNECWPGWSYFERWGFRAGTPEWCKILKRED